MDFVKWGALFEMNPDASGALIGGSLCAQLAHGGPCRRGSLPPHGLPRQTLYPPQVTFSNVEMKYRPDLPPTLKGVSFGMEASEKVGVVGRTGAGKSSLFLTLFRFVEVSSGEIFIDGVDVSKIPLAALRRALSIIPQEPILFSGTVRYNLDPFNEYTDAQLWSALEHVHLHDLVMGLQGRLHGEINEV